MQIKEKLRKITYKIEDNFFLTVVRHGLTMMIPFLLIGGTACALMNLPFVDYTAPIWDGALATLYKILNAIYQGTFGLFSLLLVIVLSLSYGMEKNETVDKVAMYILVALGAYGVQLDIGSENFSIADFGVTGSSSAIIVAFVACYAYEKLKEISILSVKNYVMGMESICATAISTLLPMIIVIGLAVLLSEGLELVFGVHNIHELFANVSCGIFDSMENSFGSGLLYTFLLHALWICGFHGSHLLEPVAQSTFSQVTENSIFSKSFFDTYIVMGGCGATICVLLVLLIFYRKERTGNLAKIASFTVIFNLNEVINFGLPIVLNPIMAIPSF